MMLTAELLKIGSRQTADGATITLKISAEDVLPHILLSAAPVGTVFVISYEIIEAGTQNGNLHIPRNAPNLGQDNDLPSLDMATHTSTSNEKDIPIPEHPKGGALAKWAGILCNDPVFWKWANLNSSTQIDGAEAARAYILRKCYITSRRQLDHSEDASRRFRDVMRDFDEWKKKQTIKPDNTITIDDLPKHDFGYRCENKEFFVGMKTKK